MCHEMNVTLLHLACHLAVVPVGPLHKSQMHLTKGELWGHQEVFEINCVCSHQVSMDKLPGLSELQYPYCKVKFRAVPPPRVTMEMMIKFVHASSSEDRQLSFEHFIQREHSMSGFMMASWFLEVGLVKIL